VRRGKARSLGAREAIGFRCCRDGAASKLIWLAPRNITAASGRAAHEWKTATDRFAILCQDRFTRPQA
jgi:transposase-like protein